jgi:uncharacterized protein
MKIFAASDLHLSLNAPYDASVSAPSSQKPMNIFGEQWDDYIGRLAAAWRALVGAEDAVLIAGDISWAMTLEEARHDFNYLASLPGKKIISRGNHDYWWKSVSRLREELPPGIYPLQNNAISLGGHSICATRGWLLPENGDFRESVDRKIYDRELIRLQLSLEAAAKLDQPIIAMLHFPPLDDTAHGSGFTELLGRYPVRYCVYGHIHGNKAAAFEGEYQGTVYLNTSVDRIGFSPVLIAEEA